MQAHTETIVRDYTRAEGPYVSLGSIARKLGVMHTDLWEFIGDWPATGQSELVYTYN